MKSALEMVRNVLITNYGIDTIKSLEMNTTTFNHFLTTYLVLTYIMMEGKDALSSLELFINRSRLWIMNYMKINYLITKINNNHGGILGWLTNLIGGNNTSTNTMENNKAIIDSTINSIYESIYDIKK